MAYSPDNPVGSTSPKDLMANAENTDLLALGSEPSYPDRKGVPRKSWRGMEGEHSADQVRRESEFGQDQAARSEQFVRFMETSGYSSVGDYGPGVQIERHNQYLMKDGQPYGLSSLVAVPYTTTGVWATERDAFVLIGDDALRQELASSDPAKGTSMLAQLGLLAGAVRRSVRDKLADIISAKDYGAVGDGLTDDSLRVQALIDTLSAQGGGCIYFPRGVYRLNVVLKKSVTLIGVSWGSTRGMAVWGSTINRWGTTFKAAGAGFVVDTLEEYSPGTGINGIDFLGLGADVVGSGVNIRNGNNGGIFKSMMFSGFADEGLIANSLACHFSDIMSTNCLLRRVRDERTGALTFRGADNYIDNIEGNTGITGIVTPDLFLCGIYIGGANNYALNLMGELSEIGVYSVSAGAAHKISNSRADLNYGHGFVGAAMFSNCHALNNSNGQPGSYSGFVTDPTSLSGAQYTGCRAVGAHKYGADVSGSDFTRTAQRPHFSNFISDGHVLAEINYPVTHGAVVGLAGSHLRNITASGVISVAGGINSIRFSHVLDSEITGFTGEHLGQVVTVVAYTNYTVFVRSSGLLVHGVDGAGKKRLHPLRAYTFVRGQTGWVETTDNYMIPMVAMRPNTYANPGMLIYDTAIKKLIIRNESNTGWLDVVTGATI